MSKSLENLLANSEGLVIKVLDQLAGHLVRVKRAAVNKLLLQEVDLHGHDAYAVLGLVELVVGHFWER